MVALSCKAGFRTDFNFLRCILPRIEMLTYWRVRFAFNLRDALPMDLPRDFETASIL